MDNGKLSRVCRPQRISESSKVSVCVCVCVSEKTDDRAEPYSQTLTHTCKYKQEGGCSFTAER